jgi:hypothetical protein
MVPQRGLETVYRYAPKPARINRAQTKEKLMKLFLVPLMLAATLTQVSLSAQLRPTPDAKVVIADVVVVPQDATHATMVYFDYIVPTITFTPLVTASPNGWGNLPSECIAVAYHDAGTNHITGDPAPGSYLQSIYRDKDGIEHTVKTQVEGNNRKEAIIAHKASLAQMMEAFPPAPKPSN